MPTPRGIELRPDIPICQTDLPLDWYQPEFKPYAEEYLALPDRLPGTVLPWMDRYIEPARAALGPELVLLAHYYMGGEIVKLVERYGGLIADSYQLAREAVLHPEKRIFVESAVHFMAEAIALLAAPTPAGVDHEPEVRLHHGDDGQGVHDRAALRQARRRATATHSW